MERDEVEQDRGWAAVPEPVGYLAAILERVKTLGPPPPRRSPSLSPGALPASPASDSGTWNSA